MMEQSKDFSSELTVAIDRNDTETEGVCKEQLLHPRSSSLTGVSSFLTEIFQEVFVRSSQLLFLPCA